MSSEAALLYEKSDGVATLTMNGPAVRNALNAEMLCRLADAWQDVNDDPAVRIAILTRWAARRSASRGRFPTVTRWKSC